MEWKNERKEQFESHMLLHYGHRLYSNINERKLRHKNLCNRQYCNNNFFFLFTSLIYLFLKIETISQNVISQLLYSSSYLNTLHMYVLKSIYFRIYTYISTICFSS